MRGVCVMVSVTRIPDHGVEVFFVGPGSTAQIGVEFLGAGFRGGDGEADIFLAGGFALFLPARTDFDTLGQNPEVRLAVRGFLLVWHDVNFGLDADDAQVALVHHRFLCGHNRLQSFEISYWMFAWEPFPGDA